MPRTRILHAAAAIAAVLALALVSAPPAYAATVTYSSVLDSSSTTWHRPLRCTLLSGAGTSVAYHVQEFTVDVDGLYRLEMTSSTLFNKDGHFTLYAGAFNPALPFTNCLTADDDSGAGLMPRLDVELTAGTNYILVTSPFENGYQGSFTNEISGPGTARLSATVTVEQSLGQGDPTSAPEVEFDVEFSEPVTGLDGGDFIIGGTAGATTVALTGAGASYVATVTGMTAAGTVTLRLPSGAAQAADATPTAASTSLDNIVEFAPPAPTATVEQALGQDDATTDPEIRFAVEFSGPVTGLDVSSFLVSGTASSSATSLTGSGSSYVLTVTAATAGTVIVSLPAAAATGAFGVLNEASTSLDNTVTYQGQEQAAGLAATGAGEPPLILAAALLGAGVLALILARRRRLAEQR